MPMPRQILRNFIFIGLFLIPFIPFLVWSSLFFPFITTKAFAFRIIVEIVLVAWVILAIREPGYRPKKSVVACAVTIFLLVIGLADLFGVAPMKSFWSNFERMEGYVALLHLGALFLVMGSVFREVDWRRWWNTSLFASFIMIIYCLFQLAGTLAINQGGVRVDGTLGNASYLAVYMLFHIFVALYLICQTRTNHILRWVYIVLIALQTFILYHTATRGAILGLIGGLLVVSLLNFWNKEDKKIQKISFATLALIMIAVIGFWFLKDSKFVRQSPVLTRFATISTEEFKSWGQDNFNYIFNKHYKPEMYALEPWFDRAHNIFLDWAVAGGFLGLLAYLSLYTALLYLIWKKDKHFSYTEKTILTGLLATYFFHNLFVFDNLISYILFFGLLAYIHSRNQSGTWKFLGGDSPISPRLANTSLATLAVLLVLVLYFVNFKPLISNARLIDALIGLQTPSKDPAEVMQSFEKAYNKSRLGKSEVVEQITYHGVELLSSNTAIEKRNEYYSFAKQAIVKQADDYSDDARYQIIAGSFLSVTGDLDEALRYLERARDLSPGKQQIYFEIGAALINKGDLTGALKEFRDAYNLAPTNPEAKIIYLVGAIYAKDRELEAKLLKELPETISITDRRILSAYVVNKRNSEAISILRQMGEIDSNLKPQIDEYIKQILNGQ